VSVEGVDDEVVDAAARGEPDALRRVYLGLAPSVLGYLRARGCADPEAVTGDVFVALLPRIPTLTGGAAGLRTLAFSIAHARMVDEIRARARRPAEISYDPSSDERVAESAERVAERRLAFGGVLDVLDVLPADQREVLALRVVADLSIEQVAAIMGRSGGAVKQLQRRALIAVRAALADRQVTG
jgi:RNA polymerase sigma factor (sigma-70 family)